MSDEQDILLPAKQIRLLSGQYVTVEPWGLETGELLMPRVGLLMEALRTDWSERNIVKVCREHSAEVREIVRETIGWTPEEMKARLKYEDLFALAQGVVEVCLIRKDFGGVVGKVLALAAQRHQGEPSQAPSNS